MTPCHDVPVLCKSGRIKVIWLTILFTFVLAYVGGLADVAIFKAGNVSKIEKAMILEVSRRICEIAVTIGGIVMQTGRNENRSSEAIEDEGD
jgi:hypothetical protein